MHSVDLYLHILKGGSPESTTAVDVAVTVVVEKPKMLDKLELIGKIVQDDWIILQVSLGR